MIRVNAHGRRVGESHPMAKVSDHEVDLIRELADEAIAAGRPRIEVYVWLARKFALHPQTIKKYVYCLSRAQVVVDVKVEEP